MSVERKKVLEMLAAGKITADDAEKLLEKLGSAEGTTESTTPAEAPATAEKSRSRYLRIEVDEPDGKKVNLRVPLAFVRSGMAIAGVLPEQLQQKLSARGINIGLIAGIKGWGKDSGVAQENLQDLNIDVDEPDGKRVRIYCE